VTRSIDVVTTPRPKVLLVEDDRPLRASIARGLRENGYEVDQAETGPDALAMATAKSYDAVVLDILLPGLKGDAVCGQLRANGVRMPVLMLTALDAVEQRIAGLDAGADDYLTKPFDFGELLARLRALIRRSHQVLASRIVIGDLSIDTVRRSVRRGARDISLTAKEYELLLYLARNAGRVVARSELMQEVWGGEARSGHSNLIDVYAGRLRRKIDEGEGIALLATLRGSGLLLEAPARARRARSKAGRE
jgi:two-component system copper resistance phosphate regulon response regulator CusR